MASVAELRTRLLRTLLMSMLLVLEISLPSRNRPHCLSCGVGRIDLRSLQRVVSCTFWCIGYREYCSPVGFARQRALFLELIACVILAVVLSGACGTRPAYMNGLSGKSSLKVESALLDLVPRSILPRFSDNTCKLCLISGTGIVPLVAR